MTCTTRKPLFHDLYGSYESCQAIHGSYLFDSIGKEWDKKASSNVKTFLVRHIVFAMILSQALLSLISWLDPVPKIK